MSFAAGWSTQEIFLAIAIISTLLLGIFFLYRLFSDNEEVDKQALPKSQFIQLEALSVLLFTTVFGWTASFAFYCNIPFQLSLLYGAGAGLMIALLANLIKYFAKRSSKNKATSNDMGKVSKSIPPNRAGIGKVYLKSNRVPLELDAITIGRELPVGAPVRIVDMLDDHTAVVEPLDDIANRENPGAPV